MSNLLVFPPLQMDFYTSEKIWSLKFNLANRTPAHKIRFIVCCFPFTITTTRFRLFCFVCFRFDFLGILRYNIERQTNYSTTVQTFAMCTIGCQCTRHISSYHIRRPQGKMENPLFTAFHEAAGKNCVFHCTCAPHFHRLTVFFFRSSRCNRSFICRRYMMNRPT